MMHRIALYVLSVTAAGVICGIILSFSKKTQALPILKLVCGLFLAVTVLKPAANIDLTAISDVSFSDYTDGVQAAAVGENFYRDTLSELIKQETEAYILDKAAAWNVSPEVEVIVEGNPPVPTAVRFYGEVSPYAKQQLERILYGDLGIPKENQQWTG